MDFTDLQVAYAGLGSDFATMYIITTVFFAIGIVTVIRFLRTNTNQAIFPLNMVLFAYVTGLIFRAISLGVCYNPPTGVTGIFSSYDYPRLIFFTLSSLIVHLMPLVTVHYIMSGKNLSLRSSGAGILVLSSYLFALVVLAVMIALAVVASQTAAPDSIDIGRNVNQYMPSNSPFRALTDALSMLGWFYVLIYVVIMATQRQYLRHWSLYVFMILVIISEIGETVALFMPSPPGDYNWIIVQYVFSMQVVFPTLLIATRCGSQWLPTIDNFLQENEQYPLEPPAYIPPFTREYA